MENDVLYNRIMNVVHEEYGPPGGGGEYDLFDMTKPEGAVSSDRSDITPYFFYGRTGITSISIPNQIFIEPSMFRNCTNLQSVNTGTAKFRNNGSNEAFKNCTSLIGFVEYGTATNGTPIPSTDMFNGCTSMEYVDLRVSGFGGSRGFSGCSSLDTIVLRKTTEFVNLSNINWFTNTPFASDGTGGTLYVPQALISSYQSATNWSTILGYANNSIQAIEGSIYETQYADGTPIPTP